MSRTLRALGAPTFAVLSLALLGAGAALADDASPVGAPAPAVATPPAVAGPPALPPPWPRPTCRDVDVPVGSRWTVTPRARAWWAVPAGDHVKITLGGEPGTGTDVDTDSDMDLEADLAWEVGVDVAHGRHRARLAYESIGADGTNLLDRDVTFHGVTYAAGETVESEIDLRLWKASYDFRVLGGGCDAVRVGVGAWVWTFEGRMEGSRGPATSREFTHVYPVATLNAEKRFGRWVLGAGAVFGMLDTDRYVLDVEAHGGLRIGARAEVDLGYRVMRFAFRETTNDGDLLFHGPFAGVSFDL